MNQRRLPKEQGQALFESIFILLILGILLLAIQFTGQLRAHSLELLGKSSYLTFLQSRQIVFNKDTFITGQSRGSRLLNTFSEQLLNVYGQGKITVTSKHTQMKSAQAKMHILFGSASVERSSFLYINAGNSHTPLQVQSRIANSDATWRATSHPTQNMLKPFIAHLARTDSAWGRGRLSLEWLNSLAGQVPRKHHFGGK
ncbi:hypothetical protein [Zwartia vadi]|uniref:hypothetical protein n=1 Tax=Zwartia vadi TaxID=3058168 RepID=UPI0025B54947|nr:hypothetical protein [Zwartia vadi]MDN3988110.1 hypothetical protein [Zwartia vadi]